MTPLQAYLDKRGNSMKLLDCIAFGLTAKSFINYELIFIYKFYKSVYVQVFR